ncbi:MAG TPA: right-handed parallel beta-helix repeat-containing protein [Roseiarcus sp.]|nr:right-handed parallel beta-helix repeat-containing protein [Roseiarcus sp.]
MKSFIVSTFAAVALSSAAGAAAPPVFPGCAEPPEKPNQIFWFDAVGGDDARGDGSEANPWKTIQSLFAEGPWGAPRLSTAPYPHTDPATGIRALSPNAAAPVKPGDWVYLKDGDYGRLNIGSWGRAVTNSDFVTIAAAPGAHPVVSQIAIQEAHKWRVSGLKLQSQASTERTPALFYVTPGATSVSDIVLDGADLASVDDAAVWTTQAEWVANARTGVWISGGGKTTCFSIVRNHLHNVRFGALLAGDRTLFEGNEIDHLGDDGIDVSANHVWVLKNREHDFQQLGDGVHVDMVQGQVSGSAGAPSKFEDIKINYNFLIRQLDRNLAFPSGAQGVDAYNGDWTDVEIVGNVIVTSACWGVSWGSTHNGLFAHNTIAFDGAPIGVANKEGKPVCKPQLAIGTATHEYKQGGDHVIAINNIAPAVTRLSVGAGPFVAVGNVAESQYLYTDLATGKQVWQHKRGVWPGDNIVLESPLSTVFRTFDPANFAYDLRPKPGAVASRAGVPMPQNVIDRLHLPERDIDGQRFGAPPNVGAYAAQPRQLQEEAKPSADIAPPPEPPGIETR